MSIKGSGPAARRPIAAWVAVVLAGIVAGILTVKPAVVRRVDRANLHNGPWRTSASTGSAQAGIYERAAVAVAGLYALAKEETVYYTAFTDSGGERLDGRCDYVVVGQAPSARWWSLTLYGADNYLVPNAAGVYSRHAANLARDTDGTFRIEVSAQERAQNWLPSPPAGAFSITLRLYNPAPVVYQNLGTIGLPSIVRGACR